MGPLGSETRRAGRWRRRRRAARAAAIGCVVLTLVAWTMCALSYAVEWSLFTAGPQRPRPASAQSAMPGGSPAGLVERDETHWMFGHGRIAIVSSTVYTTSFAHPGSAMNSRVLAWATFDDWFIAAPYRFDWYPQGPLMGVSLWLPAAAITGLSAVVLAVRAHRPRPGECVRCRYDLSGTAERPDIAGRCPECGAVQRCAACSRTLQGILGSEACPGCGWTPQRA